ncbi:P-loop NTPase fold protein [Kitasatospora purpeofusca]|uniref:P-loop NTPase fold protein n=1 Tax=Kitasatospora purpeofusca TaxID=67352 RepID=UPI0035DDE033
MTVLESLKLFLGESHCVFVLALDVDVLSAVATNKFGKALTGAPDDAVSGSAYLEKIVQLPFFLPDIGFETMQMAFRPSLSELGDNLAFWELVKIGLGTNPRRVKRYLNVLNLSLATSRALTGRAPTETEQLQLAELLIIQSRHRAFYHLLTREPGGWSTLEQYVTNLRRQPQANRDAARAMLPMSLAHFAADDALVALLDTSPGSYNDHPPAPAGDEVRRMISTLHSAVGPETGPPA